MGEKRIKRVMFKFEDDKWGFIDEFDRIGEYDKSLMSELNRYLYAYEDNILDFVKLMVVSLIASESEEGGEDPYIRVRGVAYANDSEVVNEITRCGYSKYNLLTNPYISNANIKRNEPVMRWWYYTTKEGRHYGGNTLFTIKQLMAGEIESIDAIDYVYYMSLKPSRSSDGYELEMDHRITSNSEYINSDRVFAIIDKSTNNIIDVGRDQIDTGEKINSYVIENADKNIDIGVYIANVVLNNFDNRDTFLTRLDDIVNDDISTVYFNTTPIIMDTETNHSYSHYVLSQLLMCDNNEYCVLSETSDDRFTEDNDYVLIVNSDHVLVNFKRLAEKPE